MGNERLPKRVTFGELHSWEQAGARAIYKIRRPGERVDGVPKSDIENIDIQDEEWITAAQKPIGQLVRAGRGVGAEEFMRRWRDPERRKRTA